MSARGISEKGFTLIEMLVVLVVMGIGITMVSLSIGPSPDKQLRDDAQRLVNAFIAAQSEARSDGRVIRWMADDSGWRFERRARARALATDGNDARRPDAFPKDELLSPQRWRQAPMTLDSQPALPLVFDTEWIATPLTLHLQSGGGSLTITRDAAGQYEIR
jgi:general secretion pathway protein H